MENVKYAMYKELQHLLSILSSETPTDKHREMFKRCSDNLVYETLTTSKISQYINASEMLLRHHNIDYTHKHYTPVKEPIRAL